MDSISAELFNEVNPAKKDMKWADKSISNIRRMWTRFVDPEVMKLNKSYLYSSQSMDKVKALFQDEEFLKNVEIRPVAFVEAIRKVLIEELTQTPPRAEIKATDPSAIADMQRDLSLLKNRKFLLAPVAKYSKQVGLPPKPVDYSKFKSNIDDFDKMGLDENDPDDLTFFQDKMQKLNYVASLQSVINNVMKGNRFDEETARKFVDDILAVNKICLWAYVDSMTGEIKYKYIFPETAWGIWGDSNFGHDDTAHGWQDSVTVAQWIQMAGNDFRWDEDWPRLVRAINYQRGEKVTGYSGFDLGNGRVFDLFGVDPACTRSELLTWNNALNFTIYVGYVEWVTLDATGTYLKSNSDENFVDVVPYDYQFDDRRPVTEYYKESYYQQQWYCSNFLVTGFMDQRLYNFKKVNFQHLYGANSEYSSGTLIYVREPGKPAIELVMADIDMGNETYYKMRFLITKAKQQDDVFIWEELLQQAKIFKQAFPENASKFNGPDGIIKEIMKVERSKSVKIRSYPQIDGKTVPQLPNLNGGGNGGADPLMIVMQGITQWCETLIARRWGVNSMRVGGNPPSRESQKSEMASVDASRNATGFVYRMIQYLKERVATTTLSYAQDISKYPGSLAYKYLLNLVGTEKWNAVEMMNEYSAHTMGIFIRDYNIDIERNDMRNGAMQALMNQQIDYSEYLLVTQTEDPKDAMLKLSVAIYKKSKKMRKQQIEDQQIQMQIQQQASALKMQELRFDRETQWGTADKKAAATIQAARIAGQSRVEVKEIGVMAEPGKQDAKAAAQQDLEYTKANIQESQAFDD